MQNIQRTSSADIRTAKVKVKN